MSKPIEDYTMRELRQELDAERTTKNILRDTYEKLEQELTDYRLAASVEAKEADRLREQLRLTRLIADNKEVQASEWHKKFMEADKELADTKKRLEDVVKQYERVMNEVLHLRGLRYDLEAFKKEALEVISRCHVEFERTRLSGDSGFYDECETEKRARSFLQKHTTKMEG